MKKHEPKFDFPLACKTPMSPFISRNTERRMIHKGVPGRGKGLPEDIRSDLKKQIFDALQNHSSFPIQRYYSSNKEWEIFLLLFIWARIMREEGGKKGEKCVGKERKKG